MQYFSTNHSSHSADFREATLEGQPDDSGLYFPERIPRLSRDFLSAFREMDNPQIAFEVIRPYVGDAIGEEDLFAICRETVDFDFPLVQITDRISALELCHGPTLAFKDVGARFMSRCLRYFSSDLNTKTVVIVATSGDTGGAVASAFQGIEGIEVVILYPSGKVSRVQELQLTTLGANVTALEVDGVFDDCQALAKRALADGEIQSKVFLTSANSINIARWLPQQFYYFFALKQWDWEPPVFSVPSGNFGNICAGLLANSSGMPASGFIAACNANASVPDFISSGRFSPRDSISTLSNAMDVGNPSNFARILEIFGHEFPQIKERIDAVSISDAKTTEVMKRVYEETGYVLDPHGAVGYKALEDRLSVHPWERGIFLETAHPVKFDSVHEILGTYGNIPAEVSALLQKKKDSIQIPPDYETVKEFILSKV
jgi:threonine synthase